MRLKTLIRLVPLFACLAVSCSVVKKSPPPQPEVESLLKQIADSEKKAAEADVNPNLGVKVTWTVQSVEVRPQSGNEAQPYAGTIHFLVESQTPELDGVATERFERSFEYVWDLEAAKWIPQ